MKKWITKFKHWKFDKKLRLFETVSILLVALTVAGVSLSFCGSYERTVGRIAANAE